MTLFNEGIFRSFAKDATWRVIQMCLQLSIGLVMTGSWLDATKLVGWGMLIYSALYFTHERLWNKAAWARVPTPDGGFVEKQRRAWAKNLTWKMIVLTAEWVVGMIVMHNSSNSVKYALTVSSISIVLYWLHERFWNWVRWNRRAEPVAA